MKKYRILCFGDSLTWGFNPDKRTRIDEDDRWVDSYIIINSWKVVLNNEDLS